MMIVACARCHAQVSAPPGYPSVACPHCGNVTAVGSAYGAPMMMYAPGPSGLMLPKCSRATYIVLGLFLGGLGIHNFVAGRVGAGVAQLLITLLTGWLVIPLLFVGLWVLIELIAVDTDGNGMRMN
jgi:TM2 domain-containing membrane protein YozV